MASCPKCGRPKVGKNESRQRRCRRCGTLRGQEGLSRDGIPLRRLEVANCTTPQPREAGHAH